jgi:DMSO/TMAO reductase YedYZ molybdopterin-dependent catalytic subunit
VKPDAREFVFFGADHGEEEIEWRTQKFKLDQQFGRSLNREKAMSPDPFLAWALNGDPLTLHQGSPLRLIVPGWYGVANVKWLSEIHVQQDAYLGKFQARWYRTLRGEMIDRVTKDGTNFKALGVILNDGSPIKSVEVKVDDGPWQMATIDPATTKDRFAWKFFNYSWSGTTAGEHTIVSRVTDAAGHVQPTEKDLENKKSFLEHNAQAPRKMMVS